MKIYVIYIHAKKKHVYINTYMLTCLWQKCKNRHMSYIMYLVNLKKCKCVYMFQCCSVNLEICIHLKMYMCIYVYL